MSDMSVGSHCCTPLPPIADWTPTQPPGATGGTALLEEFLDLQSEFGADGVISASEAKLLKRFAEYMKEQIASDPKMPQAIKDDVTNLLDGQVAKAAAAVPCGASEGLEESPCGEALDTWSELFAEGLELANEQGLCEREALDFAMDYAREGMEHAYPSEPGCGGPAAGGEEGVHEERTTGGGSAGAAEESGGSSAAGGASESGGGGSSSDMDEAYASASNASARQESDNARDRGTGGAGGKKTNWLVALAGALAELQNTFLNAAMKNIDTMARMAESAVVSGEDSSPEEKKAAEEERRQFLVAQSEYQANMQMFNMMANMTATSLKSIGEGLTAIARKQ